MRKVFLVDLDNTLLDVEKLKQEIERNFIQFTGLSGGDLLWTIYGQVRKERGFVDILEIGQRLALKLKIKDSSKITDIFYQAQFKKYLIPCAVELLQYLKTLGKVKILSLGEDKWQSLKVKRSGIERVIGKENIYISTKKNEQLLELIGKFKNDGVKDITVIDDKAEVLQKVCQADRGVCGLWIKYGWYKDLPPQDGAGIQFEAESLKDIFDYLKNQHIISKLDNLVIRMGLLPKQVSQLIRFTNKDQTVQKFTSDLKRFKNQKTFLTWLGEKERVIYTLSDQKDNLLGILWFSNKQMPKAIYPDGFDQNKYQLTFGIRTYGKARGRDLAQSFMKMVFENYFKDKKDVALWAVTSPENKPAVKLYKNFGFQEVTEDKKLAKIITVYNKNPTPGVG